MPDSTYFKWPVLKCPYLAGFGCPLTPDDRKMTENALREALYEGRPYSIDFRIIRPDGSERVIHAECEVTFDKTGKPLRMVGTSLDITERKRTEQELRALSRRLVDMQETERRNIACDLHDQIGQSLTALKLLLERIRQGGSGAWAEVQSLTNDLMLRVRNMSLDLRPSMLDDLGLLPTLLWHFDRYSAQTRIRVNFKHWGLNQRLPLEVSTAAYRIVQEALTNVARHAEVTDVNVRAWVNEDVLHIQIEDKGKGFDRDALAAGTSSGLSGMRERTLLLEGRLDIESTPGRGATISAEIPLSSVSMVEGDKRDKHSISR